MGKAEKDSSATASALFDSACLRTPGIPVALAPNVGVVGPALPNALRARPSIAGVILGAGDELDAGTTSFPSGGRACVALLRGYMFHKADRMLDTKIPYQSSRIVMAKVKMAFSPTCGV